MLRVTNSLCTAWERMTETQGLPKCSVCHFVLGSPCFFFPICHPGSLSFPSAMRAAWEVGAGFSALCLVVWSEAEHSPSAMQPMCQAAHLAHPIYFNEVASYSFFSFFYSQKSYCLCLKLKQMFTLRAYYHTVSPSKTMEKTLVGLCCVKE